MSRQFALKLEASDKYCHAYQSVCNKRQDSFTLQLPDTPAVSVASILRDEQVRNSFRNVWFHS